MNPGSLSKLSDLPKATQLVSGKVGRGFSLGRIRAQIFTHYYYYYDCYVSGSIIKAFTHFISFHPLTKVITRAGLDDGTGTQKG